MSEAAKKNLEEEARAWAAANGEAGPSSPPPPSPPPNAPGSTATPASSPPPREEPKAEPQADDDGSAFALDSEDLAEFGVTAIDFALQNFVSERCAFKPKQKEVLNSLAVKTLDKYLPMLDGAVEPEYALAGAVAFFAFTNYRSTPGPAKKPASPGGGSEQPNGTPGTPSVSTEASVDGKPVEARVLQ